MFWQAQVAFDPGGAQACAADSLVDDHGAGVVVACRQAGVQGCDGECVGGYARIACEVFEPCDAVRVERDRCLYGPSGAVEGRIRRCWLAGIAAGWGAAPPRLSLARCSGLRAFNAPDLILGLLSLLAEVKRALYPGGAEGESAGHHAALVRVLVEASSSAMSRIA